MNALISLSITPKTEGDAEKLRLGLARMDLYDASYHETDSSDAAFTLAAAMAFRNAERDAQSVLLEPQMRVTAAVPEEHLDDVIGSLAERRGRIVARAVCQGAHIVHARVPLAGMLGYAGDLRGRTRGRATFAMEFDEYVPCPVDDGTGDRDSMVGAPRPHPKPTPSRVALPEPRDTKIRSPAPPKSGVGINFNG